MNEMQNNVLWRVGWAEGNFEGRIGISQSKMTERRMLPDDDVEVGPMPLLSDDPPLSAVDDSNEIPNSSTELESPIASVPETSKTHEPPYISSDSRAIKKRKGARLNPIKSS